MKITELDLQCEDIMWFAVDNHGHIFACTSAGEGNVTAFVCDSRENVDFLENFFLNELQIITQPRHYIHAGYENQLLNDFIDLAKKGIYCFDSHIDDHQQRKYRRITAPIRPISFNELPDNIQHLLRHSFIDVDIACSHYIVVPHAY